MRHLQARAIGRSCEIKAGVVDPDWTVNNIEAWRNLVAQQRVGIVTSVGEEDVNIYKEIEGQAFVDFRVLEEVMVLLVELPDPLMTTTTVGATTTTTVAR